MSEILKILKEEIIAIFQRFWYSKFGNIYFGNRWWRLEQYSEAQFTWLSIRVLPYKFRRKKSLNRFNLFVLNFSLKHDNSLSRDVYHRVKSFYTLLCDVYMQEKIFKWQVYMDDRCGYSIVFSFNSICQSLSIVLLICDWWRGIPWEPYWPIFLN